MLAKNSIDHKIDWADDDTNVIPSNDNIAFTDKPPRSGLIRSFAVEQKIGDVVVEDGKSPEYVYTMGVSNGKVRLFVTDWIVKNLHPKVVLDLGCGAGAYGQFLKKIDSNIQMIGVDGCIKYLTSMHIMTHYDISICSDLWTFLKSPINIDTDLILLMDVIEHFPKENAEELLQHLNEQDCTVIISTPLFWYEQGVVDGNELEKHQCWFSSDEIVSKGFEKLFITEHDERGDIGAFIKR